MNRHHGVNTLPAELASLIFDWLSLTELLVASHVSRHWWSIAHRHPTFWRDVTLPSASPAALDFLEVRLEAGFTRSVTVRVTVPYLEFPAEARSVVLSTISRNLYRTDGLYIELDIAFDTELLPILTLPAPRLTTLDLCMVDNVKSSDVLSPSLFANHAPNLRCVRLINVQLRSDQLPHVFSSITELNFFGEALSFPTALFSHCTALETLLIYVAVCSLEVAEGEQCTLAAERLHHVDLSMFSGSSEIMQRLPCASIADISLPVNDKQSAQLLLGHLRGPLEVHLEMGPPYEHLHLRYRSPDTGMQRMFRCAPQQVAAAYLQPVYVAHALLARVAALHAPASCAPLFPAFDALPSCTHIVISLEDGGRLEHPARALRAPKLKCIEISSQAPQSMTAGDLSAFLDAVFMTGTDAVQVALAGVTLGGTSMRYSKTDLSYPLQLVHEWCVYPYSHGDRAVFTARFESDDIALVLDACNSVLNLPSASHRASHFLHHHYSAIASHILIRY